jgi:uncharacterized membrane protein YhaH (DUF805 family)
MHWYLHALKNYAVFNGRARRTEFWMFTLVNAIISAVLLAISYAIDTQVIGVIYDVALLLPSLAVSCRRLHDTERSGWWILLAFIPVIGTVVLLVFMVTPGRPGPNKYGPSPKDGTTA